MQKKDYLGRWARGSREGMKEGNGDEEEQYTMTYVWKCYNETICYCMLTKIYLHHLDIFFVDVSCPISVGGIPGRYLEKMIVTMSSSWTVFFFLLVRLMKVYSWFAESFIFGNQDVFECSGFCWDDQVGLTFSLLIWITVTINSMINRIYYDTYFFKNCVIGLNVLNFS